MLLSIIRLVVLGLLAVLFVAAGIGHFVGLRQTFIAIVPRALPFPEAIVSFTGIAEIAGGIGLVVPATTRAAGIAFLFFLVAVFPANVVAAQKRLPYSYPLWPRAVVQVVLMAVIAWAAVVAS